LGGPTIGCLGIATGTFTRRRLNRIAGRASAGLVTQDGVAVFHSRGGDTAETRLRSS